MNSKLVILLVFTAALFFASSCNKCYECAQYCAYCETTTGVRIKVCSTKGVNQYQVDSTYNALVTAGYRCNKLTDDRKVCDPANKINDAVNYYYKQDYYCNEIQ